MGSKAAPSIKLYTNHACPWAHRAHIALAELGLSFEEEIIDLSTPRTPEYLQVNPRGLVPSINYNGEIITESAIVAQFLADTHPSHLAPVSSEGALQRARIAYFVDAWFSKVNGLYFKVLGAKTESDSAAAADDLIKGITKEIEPLLKGNTGPFFGGSAKLTLAEVLTGPFILRLKTFSKPEHGLLPPTLAQGLAESTPEFNKWAEAVSKHPSVTGIFKEDVMVARTKDRIAKARA